MKKVIREELDGAITPAASTYQSGEEIWKALPRGPGGEALLSPEFVDTMRMLLQEGNTRENAAKIMGVQSRTLKKWLETGVRHINMEESSLYADLVWTCERCQAGLERNLVQAAMRAIASPFADGTLALKILERRNVEEWAPASPAPDNSAGKYVGMSTSALRSEVKRVLQEAAKNDATPDAEVVPQLEEG